MPQFEKMIQRIQTVYLLIVALLSGVASLFLPFGVDAQGIVVKLVELPYLLAGFAIAAVLALVSIFRFKNRKSQFMLNRLNMIVQLFLLGVFVGRSLKATGGFLEPEKAVGMFLPLLSIVLLVLANRAIKKDEDLVKSVDRLR